MSPQVIFTGIGVFFCKAGVYLDELKKFRNNIYSACIKAHEAFYSVFLDEH